MCLPCHFSDRTASRGRAARFSSAARHRARHAAGGRAGGSLWRGRNLWATNHSENGDGTYGQMMEKWWKTDGQKWWTIENKWYFTTVCSCVFYLTSCKSSLSNREMFQTGRVQEEPSFLCPCSRLLRRHLWQLLQLSAPRNQDLSGMLSSDWIRKTLAALNCTDHTT